jgi:hypothetical protein
MVVPAMGLGRPPLDSYPIMRFHYFRRRLKNTLQDKEKYLAQYISDVTTGLVCSVGGLWGTGDEL